METNDAGAPTDDHLLEALKALANPTRLQIMAWLRSPEESFAEYAPIADRAVVGVCVTHLAAKSGLAQSTVSAYMSTLERAGLVRATRVGKWTHYRRDDSQVAALVDQVAGSV